MTAFFGIHPKRDLQRHSRGNWRAGDRKLHEQNLSNNAGTMSWPASQCVEHSGEKNHCQGNRDLPLLEHIGEV